MSSFINPIITMMMNDETGTTSKSSTGSKLPTGSRRRIKSSINHIIHPWRYLRIKQIVSIPVGLLLVFGLFCLSNVMFHQRYTVDTILWNSYYYSTSTTTRSKEQNDIITTSSSSSSSSSSSIRNDRTNVIVHDYDNTTTNDNDTSKTSSSNNSNDNNNNKSNNNDNDNDTNENDNNTSNDNNTGDKAEESHVARKRVTDSSSNNESSGSNSEQSGMLPREIPPEILCVIERKTKEENCYNDQHHPSIPESNTNRSIIFIHVGKAGGGTIKNAIEIGCELKIKNLRRREVCYNSLPKSQLSAATHGYIHLFYAPKGREDIIENRIKNIIYNNDNTNNNNSLSVWQQRWLVVNQSTTFLYNIRHPYDRTKSWYSFVSPQNCNRTLLGPPLPSCHFEKNLKTNPDYVRKDNGKFNYNKIFFDTCFPTLQDFAMATYIAKVVPIYNNDPNISFRDIITFQELQTGMIRFLPNDTTGNTLVVNCSNMVHNFINGNRLIMSNSSNYGLLGRHMRANYQYYFNRTIDIYPNREIFVIRTNTLWDDLKQLDRIYLNGTGIFTNIDGTQNTHGSEQHQIITTRTTSSDGTKYLCCALRTELIYYKYLLFAASNLQAKDKQQTWQNDIQHCGFDTWYDYEQYCSNIRTEEKY